MDYKFSTKMFKRFTPKARSSSAATEAGSVQSTSAVAAVVEDVPPVVEVTVDIPVTEKTGEEKDTAGEAAPVDKPVQLFKRRKIESPRVPETAESVEDLPFVAGKLRIHWPPETPFKYIKQGVNWGIPHALTWKMMQSYDNLWYSRYSKGAGLGYGNPHSVNINVAGGLVRKHPHPVLAMHFSSSNQSQSLNTVGRENLADTFVDFEGAEKVLGGACSTTKETEDRVPVREDEAMSPAIEVQPDEVEAVILEQVPELQDEGDVAVKDTAVEIVELGTVVCEQLQMEVPAKAVEDTVMEIAEMDTVVCEQPQVEVPLEAVAPAELEVRVEAPEIVEKLTATETVKELTAPEAVEAPAQPENVMEEPQGITQGDIPPTFTPPADISTMIPGDKLEHVVNKILMSKLSNNWSLEAYRNKLENTVKRSHANEDHIAAANDHISEVEEIAANMQLRINELDVQDVIQSNIAEKLRHDVDLLLEKHNVVASQLSDLFNTTGNQAAEITSLEGEVKRLTTENALLWKKHEIDHTSILARLSSLEDLRRLDNANRSQEQSTEVTSAFMDGFQRCLEMQVMNGSFPRWLLNNHNFMQMVKNRDALMIKISEKDVQGHWRGDSSQYSEQQQPQQRPHYQHQPRAQSPTAQATQQQQTRQQSPQQKDAHGKK